MKGTYTVDEVARLCGSPVRTIYRRIEDGAIKTFRPGGGKILRVTQEELVRFIESHGIPMPQDLSDTRPRLLIVDNDEALIRSLRKYFETDRRFEVEFAMSGLTTGIALKSFRPAAILLDIALGDIDGRELFRELRRDPALGEVKVLAISGFLGDEEVPDLLKMGFDDYIGKPFEPESLVAKVVNALRRGKNPERT